MQKAKGTKTISCWHPAASSAHLTLWDPSVLLLRAKYSQLWALLRGLKDGSPRKGCPVVPITAFTSAAFTYRVKARQRLLSPLPRVFFLPGFFSFWEKPEPKPKPPLAGWFSEPWLHWSQSFYVCLPFLGDGEEQKRQCLASSGPWKGKTMVRGSTSAANLYLHKKIFLCAWEKSCGEKCLCSQLQGQFIGVWSCTSLSLLSSDSFASLLLHFLTAIPHSFPGSSCPRTSS